MKSLKLLLAAILMVLCVAVSVAQVEAASYPDSFEPNDSPEQAYSVNPGQLYASYISDSGDLDYYLLRPTADGQLSITMTPPSDKDYDLQLRDKYGNVLTGSYNNTGLREDISCYVGQGSYYLVIFGYYRDYGSEPYYFNTSFTMVPNASLDLTANSVNQVQSGNTMTVTSTVTNNSSQTATNVSTTIALSAGLSLASGQSASQSLGSISANSSRTVTWNLVAGSVSSNTIVTITLNASASNADTVQISKNVTVTVAKPSLSLDISSAAQVQSGKTMTVTSTVTNNSSQTATNVSSAISLPAGLSLAAGQSATQSLGSISGNSSRTVTWNLVAGSVSSDTTMSFTISASASNADSVQVSKTVTVTAKPISGTPAVESIKSSPACQPERTGSFGKSHVVCPVDTSTGAYVLNKQLLTSNGGYPCAFDIYYNSLLTSEGIMGRGWAHSLETYLEAMPDGTVVIHWDKNRQNSFTNNNGQLAPQETVNQYDNLTKQVDGGYILTQQDQSVYIFNLTGQLVQLSNGHGQSLDLNYSGNGQLNTISDPLADQNLSFNYNPAGLLGSVSDSLGRSVSFTYDDSHNLTGLTDANGSTTAYSYDSQSRLLNFTNGSGIQAVSQHL